MIMELTATITATTSEAAMTRTTTGREVQMKEPKSSTIEEFSRGPEMPTLFLHATSAVNTIEENAEMVLQAVSIVDKKVIF